MVSATTGRNHTPEHTAVSAWVEYEAYPKSTLIYKKIFNKSY